MRITADKYIPFLKGVLEPYAEVVYKDGRDITSADAAASEALIVRTRTRCGSSLLAGSSVKMIATATIGTDHIDLDWCEANGIEVANAAGCNAGGVMQYVYTALYTLAESKGMSLENKTIGIIGVGNVGKRIEQMGRALGFKLLLCDPPRAEKEGADKFCDLDTLLAQADIVTLHVPLDDTTRGMANDEFFGKMKDGAVFINAARGEVACGDAVKAARGRLGGIIMDTWPCESNIDRELLGIVDIATMHIAGYSYQGKQNGTAMAVQAVAKHFGISDLYDFMPATEGPEHEPVKLDFTGLAQDQIAALLKQSYDIMADDAALRAAPDAFEVLRSKYNYRTEFKL